MCQAGSIHPFSLAGLGVAGPGDWVACFIEE
jgi:hypothetical protein